MLRHLADQFRRDQRLIALHVDHDFVIAPATLQRHLGDTVGAGSMIWRGHADLEAVRTHRVGHALVVGRDPDSAAPLCTACSATRTTMGLPPISASGLPGRRVEAYAGGDDDLEAAFTSLDFFRRQLARLIFQHHRNVILDRIGQATGLADQFLCGSSCKPAAPCTGDTPEFQAVLRPSRFLNFFKYPEFFARKTDPARPPPATPNSARRQKLRISPHPSQSSAWPPHPGQSRSSGR